MAETRRQFDTQFRAGAVRIVRETGKPIMDVARDLGINPGTLANWVKRDREASKPANGVLAESERDELLVMRKWLLAPLTCCATALPSRGRSTRWPRRLICCAPV
jgi:transposase